MDSKMMRKSLMVLAALAFFSACAPGPSTEKDEHNIGEPLEDVSTPTAPSSVQNDPNASARRLSLFDRTTRKIHLFDLEQMSHVKSFSVSSPKDEHFVLSHPYGNYVIDLSLKQATVLTAGGVVQPAALRFSGKPRSAAFDPERGVLVVYDDMASVGLLKVPESGLISQNSWVGGPLFGEETISAGDLDRTSGELLLITKSGSLQTVNIEQSLQSKSWQYTTQTLPVSGVNWVAPLQGTTRVLLRTPSRLVLYDRASNQVVRDMDISSVTAEKLSKRGWPHLIARTSGELRLIYPVGDNFAVRSLYRQAERVLVSELNPDLNQWVFVAGGSQKVLTLFGEMDSEGQKLLRRYRLSDMMAVDQRSLSSKAQVRLGPDFVFSLYPSELGLAEKSDLDGSSVRQIKAFNIPYL